MSTFIGLPSRVFVLALALALVATVAISAAAQSPEPSERIVKLFEQAQQAEQAGDQANAAGFYREVVALDPRIAEAWSNLGMSLYRLQKNNEAVATFEKAVALKPSLLAPHLFAGKA